MPQIFVLPRQRELDDDAEPMSGALAYFFQTNSTTLQAIFYDAALTIEAPNPLPADSAGRWPKVYLNPAAPVNYRVRITTQEGEQIYQEDDVDRFTVTGFEIAYALNPATDAEEAAGVDENIVNYGKWPSPWKDISRFVSDNTGATDVSTQMGYAFAAEKNIIIPDGIYRIDTSLTLRSGMRVEGATKSGVRLRAGAAINILTADGSFSNLTIANLLLDGNSIATRGLSSSSTSQGSSSILLLDNVHAALCTDKNIYIKNMTYGVLRDVVCSGSGTVSDYGLYLDSCFDMDVEGKTVLYDCTDGALVFLNCSNVKAINAKVFNNPTVTASRLVLIDSCVNSGLMGCTVESQGTATVSYELDIDKTQTQNNVDTFVVDCDFVGSAASKTRCVRIGATAQVYKPHFYNCRFLKPSGESVLIASASHTLLEDCRDITSYVQTDWVEPTIKKDTAGDSVYVINRALTGTPRELKRLATATSDNTDLLQLTSEYAPGGTGTATAAGFGGGIAFGARSPGNVFRRDMARIAVQVVAADNGGDLVFYTRPSSSVAAAERARIPYNGGMVLGTVALDTTATYGFMNVPTCAGAPTGVPTAYTGTAPLVIDTTNNRLYFYSTGSWRNAGP